MDKSYASIWTLAGRQKVPFVLRRDHHRELLAFQRGETDLVYRDKEWFLFTRIDAAAKKQELPRQAWVRTVIAEALEAKGL